MAAKPIAERLGLNWPSQFTRLKDDPVLSEGVATITIPSPGGTQETTCLRLDLLNGWLFKIESRRVAEHLREALIACQRECFAVLHEHFHPNRKEAPLPEVDDWLQETNTTKLKMIAEARHIFGNQSAAQLWFKVGMPAAPGMLHDPRQITLFDYSTIKSVPQETPDGEGEDAA